MAVTRLKRKAKRNKIRAKQRKFDLKKLTTTPVIKKVELEEKKTA